MTKEIKEKKKYPYYKIWKRVMADKSKEIKIEDWEKELVKIIKKYTEKEEYFDLVDGFIPLETFIRQLLAKEKQKLVKRIKLGVATKELDNDDFYKGSSAKQEIGYGYNRAIQKIEKLKEEIKNE